MNAHDSYLSTHADTHKKTAVLGCIVPGKMRWIPEMLKSLGGQIELWANERDIIQCNTRTLIVHL